MAKLWYLTPLIYRVTLTVWQFCLNKYCHAFSWMYFFGYFALSTGPNWEVIGIIPIFGVIFVQNLGICPPPPVTIYRGTPHCLAITFEEILSWFILTVFLWLLCIINWSKLESYCYNTNIWAHFFTKFGYFTSQGDHT